MFDVEHPLFEGKQHDQITLVEKRCWTQVNDLWQRNTLIRSKTPAGRRSATAEESAG
jgi:hypothetical protein